MKVKSEPCKDGHDFYPDYMECWECSGGVGCEVVESHCRKCGWYISECGCGAESGQSKTGINHYRAMVKRQNERMER